MATTPTGWATTASIVVSAAFLLCACAGSPDAETGDPTPTSAASGSTSATDPGTAITPGGPPTILTDGTYRAASYVPPEGFAGDASELEAGTLVDLGDGCLGLENEDGDRTLVAFPVGTTLEGGVVGVVGMAPFGLGQPLRYRGGDAVVKDAESFVALPAGCPVESDEVWFFVAPDSAGVGGSGDD